MKGKGSRVLLLIFILLFSTIQILSSNVKAVDEEPEVILTFNDGDTYQEADVSNGICTLFFNGTVTAMLPSDGVERYIDVNLQAHSEMKMYINFTPEKLWIIPGEVIKFSAHITLLPGFHTNKNAIIKIGGSAEYFPFSPVQKITPIFGYINYKLYANFTLSCKRTSFTIEPGDKCHFNLEIYNKGNSNQTFIVQVLNNDEVENANIDLFILHENNIIKMQHQDVIIIVVETSKGIESLGEHKIKIQVKPMTEDGADQLGEPQNITFNIKIPENKIYQTTDFCFWSSLLTAIIISSLILTWVWKRRKNKKSKNK